MGEVQAKPNYSWENERIYFGLKNERGRKEKEETWWIARRIKGGFWRESLAVSRKAQKGFRKNNELAKKERKTSLAGVQNFCGDIQIKEQVRWVI